MKASAKILNTFTPQIDYLEIEKDGQKIKLNSREFVELKAMLDGKREKVECTTDASTNLYTPEFIYVWTSVKEAAQL